MAFVLYFLYFVKKLAISMIKLASNYQSYQGYSPGSQTQHGGDVVFCWIVKVNRHVAVQLLSSAPLALLRQPQLLSDYRHGHDEQVTARSTDRRAAAAAAVASPTDWCLPFAVLLLHVVAARREPSQLEYNTEEKQRNTAGRKEIRKKCNILS